MLETTIYLRLGTSISNISKQRQAHTEQFIEGTLWHTKEKRQYTKWLGVLNLQKIVVDSMVMKTNTS